MLSRALMHMVSPGGSHGRLSILIYHRVLPERDPIFPEDVDAQDFEQHMALLSTCCNVLPLSDAVRRLRAGRLPPAAACVTFDDGYADNVEVALPILNRYGIPATVFVAAGYLDGGRMWNDSVIEFVRCAPGPQLNLSTYQLGCFEIGTPLMRRKAIQALLGKLKYLPARARQETVDALCRTSAQPLPDHLMMRSDGVRKLHAAGIEIGAHTVSHPILAGLDIGAAKREIGNGRDALEGIIRAPVKIFAYPNGRPGQDYHASHAQLVKEMGFDAAVSTAWGAACASSDPYQLPRFTPWDRGRAKFMVRLAANVFRAPRLAGA